MSLIKIIDSIFNPKRSKKEQAIKSEHGRRESLLAHEAAMVSRLRILNESLSIIDRTKNIETFNRRIKVIYEHIDWFIENNIELSGMPPTKAKRLINDEIEKNRERFKEKEGKSSDKQGSAERKHDIQPEQTSDSKNDQNNQEAVIVNPQTSIARQHKVEEVENRDLLFISYDKNIPSVNRFHSFTISLDENGNVESTWNENKMPDPSTIYVHVPIEDGYAAPLDYYPHYLELTPPQRYKYLSWLRNIDEEIDMGYVFLYYYGLEKHILTGDIDKAFNQIIRLRNSRSNKSFKNYSESALIHGAILRDRLDLLIDLDKKTEISGFKNSQFLIAHRLKLNLTTSNLISVFYKLYPKCRKAIKENRELFEKHISRALKEIYNIEGFPLEKYDIKKISTIKETRFANYSFDKELQEITVPDFMGDSEILKDIEVVFNNAYEGYKKENRELCKKRRQDTTQI